jgi:hypothetical protein
MSEPSAPAGTTSGMIQQDLTPDTCRTLWNNIPEAARPDDQGRPPPANSVDLMIRLAEILPPREVPCQHPQELARHLTRPETQDWDQSMEQVDFLVDEVQNMAQRQPAATPALARPKLFKTSDVPRFSSTKDYQTYRATLNRFFGSIDEPEVDQFPTALNRLLTSFDDTEVRRTALSWEIDDLVHPTWAQTKAAFLSALDKKFQSATMLEDAEYNWMKIHPKESDHPNDFFNKFEAATSEYFHAQGRSGIPVESRIGRTVINSRLLQIVPRHVTKHIRISQPQSALQVMPTEDLRDLIVRTWTYLPAPEVKKTTSGTTTKTATTRAAPASSTTINVVKQRPCGLVVSYDTKPAVPAEARGSIFPDDKNPANNAANAARRQFCASRGLCQSCRRPRSEHHASGPNYKPVVAAPSAKKGGASPLAIEDSPQRLLIEAAPSSSSQ